MWSFLQQYSIHIFSGPLVSQGKNTCPIYFTKKESDFYIAYTKSLPNHKIDIKALFYAIAKYVLASFLLKHIIQFGTFHNDAENANNVVRPEFHSCGAQMAPQLESRFQITHTQSPNGSQNDFILGR